MPAVAHASVAAMFICVCLLVCVYESHMLASDHMCGTMCLMDRTDRRLGMLKVISSCDCMKIVSINNLQNEEVYVISCKMCYVKRVTTRGRKRSGKRSGSVLEAF